MNDKLFIQIPARGGSKRVKSKNLRFLNGKPMLAYAVESALRSKLTDNVYVNTDCDTIAALAESLGVKVYKRPEVLGSDSTTGDEFNYDFMQKHDAETVLMVSPVCPLIEPEDIRHAYNTFLDADCDTLISSSSTRMQSFCGATPVNINLNGPLAPSQENELVSTLNWGVTIWDVDSYKKNYESLGYAYLGMKRMLHDLDEWKAVKVSTEKDFLFVEKLLKAQSVVEDENKVKYWSL